jgi:predicted metal-binding membrane protein
MMAAMMFPSAWPMVMIHARIERNKREQGKEAVAGATASFVVGYLAVWTVAGLAGYAGDLPADAAEGCLPAQVPQPDGVHSHLVEARPARRVPDGH